MTFLLSLSALGSVETQGDDANGVKR